MVISTNELVFFIKKLSALHKDLELLHLDFLSENSSSDLYPAKVIGFQGVLK